MGAVGPWGCEGGVGARTESSSEENTAIVKFDGYQEHKIQKLRGDVMDDIHRTDAVGGLRVVNDRERSRYELFARGDLIGFVSYEMSAGYLVLVHAEVRSDQRGHGLGTELATGALEDLERRGLPTRTSCSFVARFVGTERSMMVLVNDQPSGVIDGRAK